MAKSFLAIAILCLVTSLVGHHHDIINGLGKALFAIFLSLFFIDQFFGERNAS